MKRKGKKKRSDDDSKTKTVKGKKKFWVRGSTRSGYWKSY